MDYQLHVLHDSAALAHAAAEIFVTVASQSVAQNGRFVVCLSGGSTPQALYTLLASDNRLRSQVAWHDTFFFFGDERHVGPDHPDSNYRAAHEALLCNLSISTDRVFRVKAEYIDAANAAREYEDTLRAFFDCAPGQFPRFDLVMLGMGPDGHTASLFPGTRALFEQNHLVVSNWIGKLYANRITMTAPMFNHARNILFLVHGADKAAALKAVLEGSHEPAQLPAQLISPRNGTLTWLVDEAAAALLESKALRHRTAARG